MVQSENVTADIQGAIGRDAELAIDGKHDLVHAVSRKSRAPVDPELIPTEEQKQTLRRIPGKIPFVAYFICIVEFTERASYYGCNGLFSNYVNRPLPEGGSGTGAPRRGTQQTAGALGMGTSKANAVSQSFSLLAYALPLVFGYIADTRTGRFKLVCWGVAVCGLAHVLMVVSGIPHLLANGGAKAPFFLSVYILSIGAAMFKPNISPILLDQMPETVPTLSTTKKGEQVIIDPEATTERVVLWFYLLINIGGFMGVPTSYTEKYIGWWLSFLLPLLLYIPLPILLWFLKPRLILSPPGGSDLTNVFRILGICFKRGGFRSIGRKSFFDPARPSVIAHSSNPITVPWNDAFIDDVIKAFQATAIFCFFPIQNINDLGLGSAANFTSTILTTNGVPNDVISNFNSLSIIAFAPILNYGLYPLLRKFGIKYGPVKRITTGFFLATLGGLGYTIIQYYAYKDGPCGKYGSSASCVDKNGDSLVSNLSVWLMAVPYSLGGISELFVNVPAYGIAYARAPPNMRGLVTAINLFMNAVSYIIGLACSSIITDPYLTWCFGAPTIIGFVSMVAFYWIYKDLDNDEYELSTNVNYAEHLDDSAGNNSIHEKEAGIGEKDVSKELK